MVDALPHSLRSIEHLFGKILVVNESLDLIRACALVGQILVANEQFGLVCFGPTQEVSVRKYE